MKIKKLNNKGVTLVELIVSFAIVAVTVTYLYQTIFTVKKLYDVSNKSTNEFVMKNYALKLVDDYIDNSTGDISDKFCLIYGANETKLTNDNCNKSIKNDIIVTLNKYVAGTINNYTIQIQPDN